MDRIAPSSTPPPPPPHRLPASLSHRRHTRWSRTTDLKIAVLLLLCQAPVAVGSLLGLVGPVSVLIIINNNRIQRRYSRFFTISSQRHELSPTRTLKWPRCNRVQITCNTPSAYHVQHVVLRATWYEGTAQLLSLTELKSYLLYL